MIAARPRGAGAGRAALTLGGALLVVAGGALLAEEGWLRAKAALAEVLIARAFERHLGDGRPHPPWSWADTHPLARLRLEDRPVWRHVLSGASGTSLAFGIGHVDGTAPPNGDGNCVLAGHRDSRFRFLETLRVGDRLILHTREATRTWQVREIRVISETDVRVLEPAPQPRLTLVTCWPFDGLVRGPGRYVVICEPVGAPAAPVTSARRGSGRAARRSSAGPRCSPA